MNIFKITFLISVIAAWITLRFEFDTIVFSAIIAYRPTYISIFDLLHIRDETLSFHISHFSLTVTSLNKCVFIS